MLSLIRGDPELEDSPTKRNGMTSAVVRLGVIQRRQTVHSTDSTQSRGGFPGGGVSPELGELYGLVCLLGPRLQGQRHLSEETGGNLIRENTARQILWI